MIATAEAYKEILRADLIAFVHRSFLELHPNVPFFWNWHLDVLCAKLRDVMDGKVKRLIVTLPPRSLKSHIISVAFPSFVFGHRPHTRFFCASYGQTLTEAFARETLQLMSSPFYQAAFDTRVDREVASEFTTTGRGKRFATSVGGVTTGMGGEIVIIDDPLKADEALSDNPRNAVNEWMDSAVYTRQNHKETNAIIIVMQRLHEDDLVGHVLTQEPWDVLSFPAIATEDEAFQIETPYGPRRYSRKKGEPLHPEFESMVTLEAMRIRLGSAKFAAQYQQQPAPPEGLYVKEKWFPRYMPGTLPDGFDRIVMSWDTANKITELSDYSVCTIWGTKGEIIYLLDVIRGKWEFPELERKIIEVAGRYKKPTVLVEDCASGQQLVQKLTRLDLAIKPCKPEGDKQMRLCSQLATMEQGLVYLPEQAPWLETFLGELKAFPNDRHDDQVDSVSQALRWIAQHGTSGIREYYKILAAAKSKVPTEASFLVPDGISFLQTLSRGPVLVGPDRIVTVSGLDVLAYRRSGWKEVGAK